LFLTLLLNAIAWSAWAAPRPPVDGSIAVAYSALSLTIPNSQRVTVCHGFGCALQTVVVLTGGDRATLAGLLAAGHASGAAERRAVAAAVGWFDRRVGPLAGTVGHVARADFLTPGPGQFDCVDSSRNTTSLLLVLDDLGLLRHHQVKAPQARGFLIDGRRPHATAVLHERATGIEWSVDSWTRSYGKPAEVMTLAKWMGGGED
jgi:hypothetical protein